MCFFYLSVFPQIIGMLISLNGSLVAFRNESRSEAVLEAMVYFLAVVVNVLLIRLYLYAILQNFFLEYIVV